MLVIGKVQEDTKGKKETEKGTVNTIKVEKNTRKVLITVV